jgi:hypothetical protein
MKLFVSIVVAFFLLFMMACEEPESLSTVSGVEGILKFGNAWPENVKGGAIIILDSLDLFHVADHIVTFSTPVVSGIDSAEYFIQLPPGKYAAVFVGLLVAPSLIATKLDSILAAPALPVMLPPGLPQGLYIKENEVSSHPDWTVRF